VTLSLALAVGTRGSNGFDPTFLRDLQLIGNKLTVGNHADLDAWLDAGGPEEREERAFAVGYFVACAFPEGIAVRAGDGAPWLGQYGLAPGLHKSLLAGGKSHAALSPDEGKWVSACLMAFANMIGTHQYILIRGNPPSTDPRRLKPTPGELWTLGYPEGVFFADVLNFNIAEQAPASPPLGKIHKADRVFVQRSPPVGWSLTALERSYTLSLNLPAKYQSVATDGWAPPNASNGRVLDYDKTTASEVRRSSKQAPWWDRLLRWVRWWPPSPEHVRVAERLGPFLKFVGLLELERTTADEELYPFDSACVAGRQLVACGTPDSERLRPLFVHAPRVISLASAIEPANPSPILKAVFSGNPKEGKGQLNDCAPVKECTGPFKLLSAKEEPGDPSTKRSWTFGGLKDGQSLTLVLGFDQHSEGYELDWNEPFTAIVRYKSSGKSRAGVEGSRPTAQPKDFGDEWPSTEGDWKWMQVFPVYVVEDGGPGGQPVLKVKISGIGDGHNAPILDVAGFVSGPPWCFDLNGPAKKFFNTCPPVRDGPTPVSNVPPAAAPIPMVRRAQNFNWPPPP
jgi:hypothetical protein